MPLPLFERNRRSGALVAGVLLLSALASGGFERAGTVPTAIQMPGTQPLEVTGMLPPSNCGICHSAYDPVAEPMLNWQGSMMGHAARDPMFWAAMAVAEDDFDGSGDLCIRCHVPQGWMAGRSTPTDGSALLDSDATHVSCHTCHLLTNPDQSEHLGVQNAPFVANDGGTPAEGYRGSGMYVLWDGPERLGPYSDPASPHPSLQSAFHRSSDLCGTCHDVSNPAVGDLAPNHGAMLPLAAGSFSGKVDAQVEDRAAFNNPPYRYGIVERTFSEHQLSLLSGTRVSDYPSLPAELRAGSIQNAWQAAMVSSTSGDYADGTPRFFTCQSCHMPPVQGHGCNLNPPFRNDIPRHDLTGANYWMPEAIQYLDGLDRLRLGDPLTPIEVIALDAGALRARQTLTSAASLTVTGDTVRVVNLTGHKLTTGYPEGRRMWLNVRWYDALGALLREDGAYGPLQVTIGGSISYVDTLLDLDDPFSRRYEVRPGMTQEWAARLLELGASGSLVLEYDRVTGNPGHTLGELAAQPPGTAWETFHFVLNNAILFDSRIPPYGMAYDGALTRGCLPVPETQFGNPGPGGVFEHWDDVALSPPLYAATAELDLLYQPTSWELIQFLDLANDGTDPFLGEVGAWLLDAWLNTGMAAPQAVASATWTAPFSDCNTNGVSDLLDIASGTSTDANANAVPDECELDSDGPRTGGRPRTASVSIGG